MMKDVNLGASLLIIGLLSSTFINTIYFVPFLPPIIVLLFLKTAKLESLKFCAADFVMIALCGVELVQLFCTDYVPNTISSSCLIFEGVVLWFMMRLYLRDCQTINFFISFLSLAFGVLSLITLIEYYKHKRYYTGIGIEDMTVVKYLFHPLSFSLNDWVGVLICFLPFPLYSALICRKTIVIFIIHTISFVCVNMSILVSYSRSGYIALLLFELLLLALSFLFNRKSLARILMIAIIGFCSSYAFLASDKQSIIQTCRINETTSQVRSIDGREKKWAEAIYLYKRSPITGVGSGNYELVSRLYGMRKYNTLSYRSTNTLLQILVEKGLLGIIVYILFFCISINCGIKSMRNDPVFIPFFAAMISLYCRELFFNSFFDNKVFVIFVICLLLVNLSGLRRES